MLALRIPRKDDFFESRIEPKPKPQLVELMLAVESLGQEMSECDQEIQRWRWKKQKIRNQCQSVFRNI